jgi:hypothetical protein
MVMHPYMERWGRGAAWDEHRMIPAPPGTSLGDMPAASLFAEMVSALGLQAIAVYTPWASRVSDIEWEPIESPDTNIMTWGLTDAAVNAVPEVTFGSPLPFVAIVTAGPLTVDGARKLWDGSAYAPYETQAVYRQDDAKDTPTIFFIHWGERIDMSKLPAQTLALEPKAASVGGRLVFAAQIAREGSTTRGAPSLPFQTAYAAAFAAPPAPGPSPVATPPSAGPAPIPIRHEPDKDSGLGVPIAVGVGAAALAFVIWRNRRH